MPLLSKTDLKHHYQWSAIPPDDPRVTGPDDATFLNRNEGYEVLAFINRMAAVNNWTTKEPALKVESLIKNDMPGFVRSRSNVLQWLIDNWNN